jgi:outer membrane protein, heavy metal efflux system
MKQKFVWVLALLTLPAPVRAQQNPATPPASPPRADTTKPPVTRITLDDAIRIAIERNHALQAVRATILQNQAQEITANLRPNPVLSLDSQFFPLFNPSQFTASYIENQAQFDLGIGYLFERGRKRQHRLQAAKDQTAVTRAQVSDNERQIAFNVSQQFVDVLLAQSTLDLAQENMNSFQQTLDISDARFKAGDMSQGDLLKIKLQLLQFQTDLASAKLAKLQALSALRQLLGFESLADSFDVEGELTYQPVKAGLDDLKGLALRTRPESAI